MSDERVGCGWLGLVVVALLAGIAPSRALGLADIAPTRPQEAGDRLESGDVQSPMPENAAGHMSVCWFGFGLRAAAPGPGPAGIWLLAE